MRRPRQPPTVPRPRGSRTPSRGEGLGLLLLALLSGLRPLVAFQAPPPCGRRPEMARRSCCGRRHRPTLPLGYHRSGRSGGAGEDRFDAAELERRLQRLRAHLLDQEYQRPPNPALTAPECVAEILKALRRSHEPRPDAGFRLLLRAATPRWRRQIYASVGAPVAADPEVVAAALGEAMGRPKNQFAILVGEAAEEDYAPSFPSEPIDYGDGVCWLECQLRGARDHELYAITGWTLERRPSDGAWLVDAIDWQDFRDAFRPGIGREEWHRICG